MSVGKAIHMVLAPNWVKLQDGKTWDLIEVLEGQFNRVISDDLQGVREFLPEVVCDMFCKACEIDVDGT